MRSLLVAVAIAASAAAFAPAVSADPDVCVMTVNGKGVAEMTCTPGAAGPGDNCVEYNSDSFPDEVGDATYESIRVCAGS